MMRMKSRWSLVLVAYALVAFLLAFLVLSRGFEDFETAFCLLLSCIVRRRRGDGEIIQIALEDTEIGAENSAGAQRERKMGGYCLYGTGDRAKARRGYS